MDPVRTLRQQKSHDYYMRNREKCLAASKAYQAAHRERYRDYQKEYFQKYKGTSAYMTRLSAARAKPPQRKVRFQTPVEEIPVLSLLSQPEPPAPLIVEKDFVVSFS